MAISIMKSNMPLSATQAFWLDPASSASGFSLLVQGMLQSRNEVLATTMS